MSRVAAVLTSICAALGAALVAGPVGAEAAGPLQVSTSSGQVSAGQVTVVPGPGVTLSVDGRPYAGRMVAAPGRGGVYVVDDVGFEQYVDGIGEMPSGWPAAALQAQAVASRTYALWSYLTRPAGPGGGRICATDACQVYIGLAKTESAGGADWAAAVRSTSGQVLQYEGRIIEALYGASDGGQTLYGGVPWLPSVADPEDRLAPEHQWSWSAPLSSFAGSLAVPAGQQLVSLVSSSTAITETLRPAPPAGSTTSTTAAPTQTVALDPGAFHRMVNAGLPAPAGLDLPLPSFRYSVSTYGTNVTIAGEGDGNGLGLSQYGALGKAEDGWTAGQILGNYYRGAVVAALPAGEMPATIPVTLRDGAASAVISADGPVTILDGRGRTLLATSGGGGWSASSTGGGVLLQPTGVPAPILTGGAAAPVAQRGAAPSGAATGVVAAGPSPTTVPASTTTTTVLPQPAAPSPVAEAQAASEKGPPAGHGGGGVPLAAIVLAALAMAGAGTALLRMTVLRRIRLVRGSRPTASR